MKNKKTIILGFLIINLILSILIFVRDHTLAIETLVVFCFSIIVFLYFYPTFKNKKIKILNDFSVLGRIFVFILCTILIIVLIIFSFFNIICLLPLIVINGLLCACIITEFYDNGLKEDKKRINKRD